MVDSEVRGNVDLGDSTIIVQAFLTFQCFHVGMLKMSGAISIGLALLSHGAS
jgi:hypothetical protein